MSGCGNGRGITVTTLTLVGDITTLGTGRINLLTCIAMCMCDLIGSICKVVEEALALALKNLVGCALGNVKYYNTVGRNSDCIATVNLDGIACARGIEYKSSLTVCGSSELNRCAAAQLDAIGKSKTVEAYVALRARCATRKSKEAVRIGCTILGNIVNVAANRNCYLATGCISTGSVATGIIGAGIVCTRVATTGIICTGVVSACGRSRNRSCCRVGINCSNGKTGNLCLLVLAASNVIGRRLNKVVACRKIVCCTTACKDSHAILVGKNNVVAAATVLLYCDINCSVNIEYNIASISIATDTYVCRIKLCSIDNDIIVCTGGRCIGLVKLLCVIESYGRGRIASGRNNRSINLIRADNGLLLYACVCHNHAFHLADALLDNIVTRGNVRKFRIKLEACILISRGNYLRSVGYNGCLKSTCHTNNRVVVALNRAGLYVNGILTLIEHIVLRENVSIRSGVHTIAGLTLEDIVIHVDVCLTSKRTTGFTILPIIVMICKVILKRIIRGAYKVSLVITIIVAIGVGEVLTTLEVTCTVTAILIALGRIGNSGSIEVAVMNPATLNSGSKSCTLLLTLHTYTVLGNVLEGDVSYLKATSVACCIVCSLADKMETPTVDGCIITDTLDSDVLTTGHTSHIAVVTNASTVINAIILCKALNIQALNAADNTNNKRSTILCKLANDILVSVRLTALSVNTTANILTNRVKDITDTNNGCAVFRGYRNGVLVFLGNVDNDRILLECTVIIVCTNTLGVIEVSITRTVVSLNNKCICGKSLCALLYSTGGGNDLNLIVAGLKTNNVNSIIARVATNKLIINLCPRCRACGCNVCIVAICARNGSPFSISRFEPTTCVCYACTCGRTVNCGCEQERNKHSDGKNDSNNSSFCHVNKSPCFFLFDLYPFYIISCIVK